MKWCRRNSAEYVTHTLDTNPYGYYADNIIWYDCPDETLIGDWFNGTNYITPAPIPPLDSDASVAARTAANDGMAWYFENEDRKRVAATPIIAAADQAEWDAWMKSTYDAIDAGVNPPEPPAKFRQGITMPDQELGQCTIQWHEFTGTWAGWGFKALFKTETTTSLGLKVYDENGGYLYALTFTQSAMYNEWVTETPAGFATPTKVARSFEIISGPLPVTDYLTLDDTKEYISLQVRF